MKFSLIIFLTTLLGFTIPKSYVRTYYDSGIEMSCGWQKNNISDKKNDYWSYYYDNAQLQKSGNYTNDLKNGFWTFYYPNGNKKEEGYFKNNRKEGYWTSNNDGKTRYCLIYQNKKLIKGSKYISDTFIQEWNSVTSFKRDNPDFSF